MHHVTRFLIFSIFLFTVAACSGASPSQPVESQTANSPTNTPGSPVRVTTEPSISVNRTAILDNRVSFILPDGFAALSAAEIKAKFPRTNAPQYVFANASQSVSIAITLSTDALNPAQLHNFKD
jgi:hypothetical protein